MYLQQKFELLIFSSMFKILCSEKKWTVQEVRKKYFGPDFSLHYVNYEIEFGSLKSIITDLCPVKTYPLLGLFSLNLVSPFLRSGSLGDDLWVNGYYPKNIQQSS